MQPQPQRLAIADDFHGHGFARLALGNDGLQFVEALDRLITDLGDHVTLAKLRLSRRGASDDIVDQHAAARRMPRRARLRTI